MSAIQYSAASMSLYPRFPSASFISQAEFQEYCRTEQQTLDTRYLHESGLSAKEGNIEQAGTCAPCLRRAMFTSDTSRWNRMADGRRVPEWADAMVCDCEHRLGCRARAVVHFVETVVGLNPWSRLLLFGPETTLTARLAELAPQTTRVGRLAAVGNSLPRFRLDALDSSFDTVIADNCLHQVPPLRDGISEMRRVLAPGGSLVVTVPFRYEAARSATRADLIAPGGRLAAQSREAVHEIGWDILNLLRGEGFGYAVAVVYWSNELGYLGSHNVILHAVV